MKKVIFIVCVLLNVSLYSRVQTVDQMLSTIEKGISFDVFTELNNIRFDPEKLKSVRSANNLRRTIKYTSGITRFENMRIVGALNLENNAKNPEKLIFVNCLFTDSLTLNTMDIRVHIAFIGCRFRENALFNDISSNNVTMVANEAYADLKFTAKFRNNSINEFLFALNHFNNFSVEGANVFIPCSYAGSFEIRNLVLMSNSFKKAFLSGITVNNNFFTWYNAGREMECNSLFTGGIFGLKYNLLDRFRLENQLHNKDANLAFSHNSIKRLRVNNYFLNYFLLSQNRIASISFNAFRAHSYFGIRDHVYDKNSSIHLTSCDAYKLAFWNRRDSVMIITADTLTAADAVNSNTLTFWQPILNVAKPCAAKLEYVQLKLKEIDITRNNDNYVLQIKDCNINANNWLVDFKSINKKKGRYRLNTADTLLYERHEIYTSIQNAYKDRGNWGQADACYYEWKEFERRHYFEYSAEAFFTKLAKSLFHHLNWVSCGYGIKPLRIFPFAFLIVLTFALFYFFTPRPISNLEYYLISGDKIKKALNKQSMENLEELFADYDFDFEARRQDLIEDILSTVDRDELIEKLDMKPKSKYNSEYFWNCFYFSFSTFTTVGIGDWYPTGKLNKAIVMLEGSLGWLCLGLFITTYASILLR